MCVMVPRLFKIRTAICLSTLIAFSLSGRCDAQSPPGPMIDTPSQRWLPPPTSYPNQPDSQAKLLSRLRDFVLNSDPFKDPNPSRLSDAEVQSLKEAMKLFGGNLPDGLTADSLDTIPPDLISKALSNPELVRQAKELANQFSKTDREKSTVDSNKPNDSPAGEIPQRKKDSQETPSKLDVEKGVNPKDQSPRSLPAEKRLSQGLPQPQPPRNGQAPSLPGDDSRSFDSKQNQQRKQPTKGENSTLSNTIRDLANDGNSLPTQSRSSSSNSDLKNEGSLGETSAGGSSKSKSSSSMDIRKELVRSGFGATLQKLVEDAQRSSQSSRPTAPPLNGFEQPALSTKTPISNTDQLGVPEPAKQPPRPANPNRTTENSSRPAKPDSAISRGLQQTGKVLNNLWTQISKSTQNETRISASPSPSPQVNSRSGSFSLPNLFNAKVLECLIVLTVACAVAFFVLRYRVRSEQERREVIEARLAPKIDEIRTRDDVVRAFHAIAKQRLQSAQAWWTCGVVTERFEHSLPELTGPIRTLSVLYEQARYFPVAHQLSSDQIEDAKFALKQCKG